MTSRAVGYLGKLTATPQYKHVGAKGRFTDISMSSSRELEIMSSLVSPNASVDTAVRQLVALTSTAASSTTASASDPLFTHLNNAWHCLMEDVVVNTVPSQQALLVEFVRSLQQQQVTDPTTDDQLRFFGDYNKMVWTEIPIFGVTVADNWNFGKTRLSLTCAKLDNVSKDPSASFPDPEEESQYYHKVAFLAQLTSSPANFVKDPESHPGPFDFSLYALWGFSDAFEGTVEPRSPNKTLLRAESLWMIYAANRL
jgi:hypothetical protein